jgi:hypothetical protein
MLSKCAPFVVCVLASLVRLSVPGHAQELANQAKALQIITDTARALCESISQSGRSSGLELSGDARAKLNGAVSRLADLGIEGAAKYQASEYVGVLQQELAGAIKNTVDCRLEVFRRLESKLVAPSFQEGAGSEQSRRRTGSTNLDDQASASRPRQPVPEHSPLTGIPGFDARAPNPFAGNPAYGYPAGSR